MPDGFLGSAIRDSLNQPQNTASRGADAQAPHHDAILAERDMQIL
jgi:hypothetical protein